MTGANQDQEQYWASPAGLKWIEHEDALDAAMAGMLGRMLDAARIAEDERVLDIGCGTGASTLAAAARASRGHVLAVDISEPLLDRAKSRASTAGIANASFLKADAQSHRFENGAFDVVVSRLGMMFFDDPVQAFRNLSLSLRPGGRMAFVSWAGVARNPWFSIPNEAAVHRLGPVPKGDPYAPGPTAFQDTGYVTDLLKTAGLSAVEGSPVEIALTPPNGLQAAARIASRVGPAARIMKGHGGNDVDAAAIEDAVRDAFRQFEKNGEVVVPAVVNLFTCRKKGSVSARRDA